MNLLKDEVSLLVRRLAVPASVGTLFQTLYTIVDTFYAGKISPEALSACLLYTSPSPRDLSTSRMPSSA